MCSLYLPVLAAIQPSGTCAWKKDFPAFVVLEIQPIFHTMLRFWHTHTELCTKQRKSFDILFTAFCDFTTTCGMTHSIKEWNQLDSKKIIHFFWFLVSLCDKLNVLSVLWAVQCSEMRETFLCFPRSLEKNYMMGSFTCLEHSFTERKLPSAGVYSNKWMLKS